MNQFNSHDVPLDLTFKPSSSHPSTHPTQDEPLDLSMKRSTTVQRRSDGLTCHVCNQSFTRKYHLNRHQKRHSNLKASKKVCPKCKRKFIREFNFNRHYLRCGVHACKKCKTSFPSLNLLKQHKLTCESRIDLRSSRSKAARSHFPRDSETGVISIQSAFNRNLITYYIENIHNSENLETFFTVAFECIKNKIKEKIETWPGVKVNFGIDTIYKQPITQDCVERNFKSKSEAIYENSDIEQILHDGMDKISAEMEEYEGKGSGYSLNKIQGIVLNISKHNPLKAACNIRLPTWIVKTNSCDHQLYPDSNDCFRRAILARRSSEERNYDFSCLSFPTHLKDIEKFEEKNKVSVFIFALDEEEKIFPFAPSKMKYKDSIDVLLLHAGEHNHFVRIFHFHRLIRKQLTKSHASIVVCRRCFTYYSDGSSSKEEKLAQHQIDCLNKPIRTIMPTEEENHMRFRNIKNQLRVPFVVYCDTESLLVPISTCEPPSERSGKNQAYLNKIQEHQIMSYGMYVKSDVHGKGEDKDFNNINIYTGVDAAHHLLASLFRIGTKVLQFYLQNETVRMTEDEITKHEASLVCYFCQKAFSNDDQKVVDHNHVTGEYRGAAHSSCNLAARRPDFLPIFFHNGSGYDFKFLVRELGKFPGDIQVIPNTEERFISFSKKINLMGNYLWLRFLDSCRFLPSSLDSIVKTLSPNQFTILPKLYHGKKLELLLRKGHMPYEYMSDWSRLEETSMPPKERFYSTLTESGISDDEYQHALDVWTEFDVKNLKMYSELYLMTDVYLLTEVYENFRKEFLSSEYSLDPVHYYSIPGLAFDGMMKITGVELELLTDYDQLLQIQRGVRGGYTQVNIKHAASDEENQLLFIDANNLYGFASSQPLPLSDFEWVDPQSIDLLSVSDNSEKGYIAEVDIVIPERLHDYFDQYPPLPEHRQLPGSKYKKLIASLLPKRKYILHYKMLQFVVSHGCQLKTIHRVIGFQQSAWLAPFIQVNTEKRQKATTDFAKDLYKLLVNACFGKCIERIEKRIDLRLVNEWKKAEKLIARPYYQNRTIIDENLVAIRMGKTKIMYNRPIYAGFVILEMAKLKMLNFHYDVMLRHYGPERLRLAYTDTDSFVYSVNTLGEEWRHEAFQALGSHFDFSNLPPDHPCYSAKNKKVLGKFKDELNGERLLEWVGLRAKMYAFKKSNESYYKKAKGIKKSAVKNKITFEDYKRVLFNDETMSTKFHAIRSFRHRLFTVAINKLSLSSNDDKRFTLPDNINTLAHGHYRITEIT